MDGRPVWQWRKVVLDARIPWRAISILTPTTRRIVRVRSSQLCGPFSGCTYTMAFNYNPDALVDDGSCTFNLVTPCWGDWNGDGTVSVTDILEILAH